MVAVVLLTWAELFLTATLAWELLHSVVLASLATLDSEWVLLPLVVATVAVEVFSKAEFEADFVA
jgi:hypothetical protein